MPRDDHDNDADAAVRHIRIPGRLWRAARLAMAYRGDPSLSHIIRELLTQYVDDTHEMILADQDRQRRSNARQRRPDKGA